jgi:hypothetical protein
MSAKASKEEHRLVRGLTMSTSHADNHYCIGTVEGFDVVLLERSDSIRLPHASKKTPHSWLILEIDLDEVLDLPHIFLGTRSHSDEFYGRLFTSFSRLKKAPLGAFGQHSPEFVHHYSIYTSPADTLRAEQLFTVDITKIIGVHFRPLAIEVSGSSLYIYADNQRPTANLLETMLKNGLWLAENLNRQGRQLL